MIKKQEQREVVCSSGTNLREMEETSPRRFAASRIIFIPIFITLSMKIASRESQEYIVPQEKTFG